MTERRFSLKDHLFNAEKVAYLSGLLDANVPGFERGQFESEIMAGLLDLELKQRISLIAVVLGDHLDPDFEVAADQIHSALPPPLDPTLTDDDFGDFIMAPFGKFIEDRGLDHYETSMALLRELTKRFSMEGSIRVFINQHPEETLRRFETWAEDDNYHVRRLVSESTRPRLPWAPRIDLDLRAPLPLLDKLHSDPTRYVTRSVANHLNDIAKVEPEAVVTTLIGWRELGRQEPSELEWMTRHALRTLLKRGDREAMALLGYSADPDVLVGPIDLTTPTVTAGQALEFTVPITGSHGQALMVDYVIDFVRKNGETGPKVFKLKNLEVAAGETRLLTKRHPLRADATTYRLYPGTHRLTVVVNGSPRATTAFEVTTS